MTPSTSACADSAIEPVTDRERELAQAAVRQVATIATLPEVTAKIIRAVEDPACDARMLYRLVAGDPALVGRVLKVVNSAGVGVVRTVESIEQAIALLGMTAIKNIAIASGIGRLYCGSLGGKYSARDLWRHSLGVAVVARELTGRVSGRTAGEEAFMAAMVHDLGLLVSLQLWPEKLASVCARAASGVPFQQAELDVVGMRHTVLGEALATRWHFPSGCVSAVAHHHDPASAPEALRRLVFTVQLADQITCEARIGFPLTTVGDGKASADPRLAERVDAVRAALPKLLSAVDPLLD